jgi:predicted Zn finger-like uncharacterized protein
MAIEMTCPGCHTSRTLDEGLRGKLVRCKNCGETFLVDDAAPDTTKGDSERKRESRVQAELLPSTTPGPDDEGSAETRRRKKRRRSTEHESLRRRILLAAGGGLVLLAVLVGLTVWLVWGGHKGPNLVGKWKGAVQVQEAVSQLTKDKNIHPVAEKFLGALGQKAADELLSVTIVFKKNGTVFFSGKTDILNIPAESDGTWELVQGDEDAVIVRLEPGGGTPVEARLAFRDRNTFTFSRTDKKGETPLVFNRVRD